MEPWHSLSVDEVLQRISSVHSGLTEAKAKKRLLRYVYNELKGKKRLSPILVFLKQFLSPLIYVLIAAVIISLIARHYIDALVILGVLLLNAIVGCMQELRAEKAKRLDYDPIPSSKDANKLKKTVSQCRLKVKGRYKHQQEVEREKVC